MSAAFPVIYRVCDSWLGEMWFSTQKEDRELKSVHLSVFASAVNLEETLKVIEYRLFL